MLRRQYSSIEETQPRLYELNAENCDYAPTPPGFKLPLKPHQLALLHRCLALEKGNVPCPADGSLFSSMHGIIADKVGSGKTVVVVALVSCTRLPPPAPRPSIRTYLGSSVFTFQDQTPAIGQSPPPRLNLIVVPHTLCGQWMDCFRRFAPSELTVMTVRNMRGVHALREASDSTTTTSAPSDAAQLGIHDIDVLLVTSNFFYQVARIILERPEQVHIRRFVIDEIDTIRIPNWLSLPFVRFHWGVTASYSSLFSYSRLATTKLSNGVFGNIQNVPSRLWPMFVARCSDTFVDASFRLPEINDIIVMCRSPVAVNVLLENADSEVIKFLNAGDVHGAIQHVNPECVFSSEQALVQCIISADVATAQHAGQQLAVMDDLQLFGEDRDGKREPVENAQEQEQEQEQDHNQEQDLSQLSPAVIHSRMQNQHLQHSRQIIQANERIRKSLIEKRDSALKRIKNIRDRVVECDACSICYEPLKNKTVVPCCSNAYCFQCLCTWLEMKGCCPMCKSDLDIKTKDIKIIYDDGQTGKETNQDDTEGSTSPSFDISKNKYDNLDKLVRHLFSISSQNRSMTSKKMLLFSNYSGSFHTIQTLLDSIGVRYAILSGTGHRIEKLVDSFRRGYVQVLMLDATHFGNGMNLQDATDVVLFHAMPAAQREQMIGRAQRYGRTDPLNVWQFFYENEVESP